MNVPLYSLCWYSILYYAVCSLCWYSIVCFSLDLIMPEPPCRGLPSLDWRQMMMKWKYTSVSPPEPAYKAHTVNLTSLKSQLTSDCTWDYQMWPTTRTCQIRSTHFCKRSLSLHVPPPDNCRSARGGRCPRPLAPVLGAEPGWRAPAQGWCTRAPGLVLWLSSTRTKARYFTASGYHRLICKTRVSTCRRVLLQGWHDLMDVSCSSQYMFL